MKLITRNTDYAVRAIAYMAQHKGVFSVQELSQELKIPKPFLRRILQVLSKKNILSSTKGKSGGFKLVVSAKKIFVADLIKIFQGPIEFSGCFIKKRICPDVETCLLRGKIKELESHIIRELKAFTIDALVLLDKE